MKSSFKITIIAILVLMVVGISRVGAFNKSSYYPVGAPTSEVPVLYDNSTPQTIVNKLLLGYSNLDKPSVTGLSGVGVQVKGGFMTTGAVVNNNIEVSGKLRVAPLSSQADITALNASTVSTVSVSGGNIVYAAKKPATTRVMCTDNNGITAPCRDDSVPENIVIGPTSGSSLFPSSKNVSVSAASIQGNTAALWGLVSAGSSASNACYNGTWGAASPFNLSTSVIACP